MTEVPDLERVKTYFDERLQKHGASPRGADWNSVAAQNVRFDQLIKLVEGKTFSILDYGCGYGALADYLAEKGFQADYYGFDILESAIKLARQAHEGKHGQEYLFEPEKLVEVDYTVASGTFNMRGDQSSKGWTDYVLSVLQQFNSLSRKGFASNFLTMYSDADRMRPDLYYADPCFLFDYCKRMFSKNVAILHDYHLYDFTLIVRKD
jgi:SAM-dependent methyltransferase